jgi:hypothetical protein
MGADPRPGLRSRSKAVPPLGVEPHGPVEPRDVGRDNAPEQHKRAEGGTGS